MNASSAAGAARGDIYHLAEAVLSGAASSNSGGSMKITVNGVEIPAFTTLNIVVETAPEGETLPRATITVVGGKLDVYRSYVNETGVSIHPFGETP